MSNREKACELIKNSYASDCNGDSAWLSEDRLIDAIEKALDEQAEKIAEYHNAYEGKKHRIYELEAELKQAQEENDEYYAGRLADERHRNQALEAELKAAKEEIERLKDRVKAMMPYPGISDSVDQLRELNGRLEKELAATKEALNQSLVSCAEMSTPLGMLPINSVGMRRVVDALAALRAEKNQAELMEGFALKKVLALEQDLERLKEAYSETNAVSANRGEQIEQLKKELSAAQEAYSEASGIAKKWIHGYKLAEERIEFLLKRANEAEAQLSAAQAEIALAQGEANGLEFKVQALETQLAEARAKIIEEIKRDNLCVEHPFARIIDGGCDNNQLLLEIIQSLTEGGAHE